MMLVTSGKSRPRDATDVENRTALPSAFLNAKYAADRAFYSMFPWSLNLAKEENIYSSEPLAQTICSRR